MKIVVDIEAAEGSYRSRIEPETSWRRLELGPDAEVPIKGEQPRLGELVDGLLHYRDRIIDRYFDERGQRQIGRFLFRRLFGSTSDYRVAGEGGEIRLCSRDEDILRLPWVLLADDQGTLAQRRWSVVLTDPGVRASDCVLPPLPRILIVAPQPPTLKPTWAGEHLADLERLLAARTGPDFVERHVRKVETWADCKTQVKSFEPDVVYFYGHGDGDREQTALLFPDRDKPYRRVPMSQFAECLENAPSRPARLGYVNCCYGDAGGFLGAGILLRRFIPAVIANRAVIKVGAARALALRFFELALLEGEAPHTAQATLYRSLFDLEGLPHRSDPMWMTPVLHVSYDEWDAVPLRREEIPSPRPYAEHRFDRIPQIGVVTNSTRTMLREGKNRSFAFLWYGEPAQGVDILHDQLRSELQVLSDVKQVHELRPEWPQQTEQLDRCFSEMYTEVFQVDRFDQLQQQIRARFRTTGDVHQHLCYIRHRTVRLPSASRVNLVTIRLYLQWWERNLVHLFDGNAFVVLGFGFEVDREAAFARLLRKYGLHKLPLESTWVRTLPSLRDIEEHDLLAYLQETSANVPPEYYDLIIDHVMEAAGGRYTPTLRELQRIKGSYWELIGMYSDHSA